MKKRLSVALTISIILLITYSCLLIFLFKDKTQDIIFLLPIVVILLFIAFILGSSFFEHEAIKSNKKLTSELNIEKDLYSSLSKNNEVVSKELPVGLIIYNENLTIEFSNKCADSMFEAKLLGKELSLISIELENAIKNKEKAIDINIYDKSLEITINYDYRLIYVFDKTNEKFAISNYESTKPSIIILSIDNLEESLSSYDLKDRTEILGKYYLAIEEWEKEFDIFGISTSNNKQTFIVTNSILEKIINDDFSLINRINEISKQSETDISISLGIGTGDENYSTLGAYSEKALEFAFDRGGNQAVVYDGNGFKAYGGKSNNGVEKKSRVSIRFFAQKLVKQIEDSSSVVIMPHIDTDADALGSALGLIQLCECIGTPAKILLDVNRIDTTTRKVIDSSSIEYIKLRQSFITEDELDTFFVGKKFLIIVDHFDLDLSPSKRVYSLASSIAVIDHHRKNMKENISIDLDFIDTAASSSVELVTDMISVLPYDVEIPPFISTTMLLGMTIDTNNFASHVSSKTFEAAGFLMKNDADAFRVKMFLRESVSNQKKRVNLLENAQMIDNKYAIVIDDALRSTKDSLARTAEALLNIDNIVAGFAIGYLDDKCVGISARSNGTFNIQTEMEKFGGGGHYNMGAAQIKDGTTPSEICEELIENLRDTSKGEKNEMKVILVKDVKKQGKKGDIIECTPGFANYLMIKKLAIEANTANIQVLEDEKQVIEKSKQQELEVAKKLKTILDETKVIITTKTGEKGKFFGSISNKQVSEALLKQFNIDVDKRKIVLPEEKIETLGTYDCIVKLHKDVVASLKIEIKEGE